MNRPIKFRAFYKPKKTMLYNIAPNEWVIGFDGNIYDSPDENRETFVTETNNFELMQFTGLTDKNGVEIYEGDIVKWDDNSDGEYWRVAIVRINPDLYFEIIENTIHPLSCTLKSEFHYGNFIYRDTHNHLIVCGNIFENPGLMKRDS